MPGAASGVRAAPVGAAAVRGWLVSPAYDLTWFLAPALLTAAAALALPSDATLGLVGWLVLVVLIDVAHTWATLYRTWLDPVTRAERAGLLWGTPLAAFAGAACVYAVATEWFWTAMAYVAVFHFVRQQQGFAALYRARAGVPFGSLEARVEHYTVAMLCVFPVIWWHAHLPRAFAWFTATDFVPLPTWVVPPAAAITAVLFATWLVLRARAVRTTRTRHVGRDLWVLSTGATWFTGIVLTNGDAAFTLANVVAHGVPYFALVHHVGRRQWAEALAAGRSGDAGAAGGQVDARARSDDPCDRPCGPLSAGWFTPAALAAFLAIPMGSALLEELAWDGLVWREHLFAPAELPAWIAAIAVPLLATPQLTHYLLDGFIWKLGPAGSPLRGWLLEPAADARLG